MADAQSIAADIVAKCIAKTTIGGTYVPVGVARRAWPREDHARFQEALDLLDAKGLLLWHKVRTCFGLDPTVLGQAYAFALEHATPKRRALLEARGPPNRDAYPMSAAEVEQDAEAWEEPWLADLKAHPTRTEVAAMVAGLREDMARATQREVVDTAALSQQVNALRDEVHRLKSDAGKWRALEQVVRDRDDLIATLQADHKSWAGVIEQMEVIIANDNERQARLRVEAKVRGLTCPCGQPATALKPRYKAEGAKWVRIQDVAMCAQHDSMHDYCLEWVDKRSASPAFMDRLMRGVPRLGVKPPFVGCDTSEQALAIGAALVRHGVVSKEAMRVYEATNKEA